MFGTIMDRDLNAAAKNILLKYMIEQTTERVRLNPCVALPEADECVLFVALVFSFLFGLTLNKKHTVFSFVNYHITCPKLGDLAAIIWRQIRRKCWIGRA